MTDQVGSLQGLAVIDLTGDRAERGVQFLNAADGTDLRKLRGQFVILHRIGWVLIFSCATSRVRKLLCKSEALLPVRELEPVALLVLLTPVFVGSFTFTAMDMRVSFTGRE